VDEEEDEDEEDAEEDGIHVVMRSSSGERVAAHMRRSKNDTAKGDA
jgi:hypothetical protein